MSADTVAGARLMVVEDSLVNFQVLEAMLEIIGHTVVNHTDHSETVLANAELCKPDAILMDLALPGAGGIAATETLQRNAATSGIKVIGVSAYADEASRERALAAGMCAFVTKPVDLEELTVVLATHLPA